MSFVGRLFGVFDGPWYSDLSFIALAFICIILGFLTTRRGRYLGR